MLDKKDQKILEVLKENANYPTRKIAKKTMLPITTVHNRIKRLLRSGVIRKFTIELDYQKIGKGLLAYILISANLPLLKTKKKTQYDLVSDIKKFAFVEKIDIVTGGTDLVAMVRVKDMQEFDHVLLEKLQLVEGIDKTQTLTVIHEE